MDLPSQIRTALTTTHSLPPPSTAWLQALLSSQRHPPPPLPTLVATARARLLAADLTTPGLLDPAAAAPSSCLPAVAPSVAEARLPRDAVVQVLDVENLARSRWDQVEELEAIERGEQTRGREVVRLPPPGSEEGEDDDRGGAAPTQQQQPRGPAAAATAAAATTTGAGSAGKPAGKNATHRVVLQDCKGQKVFGLELRRLDRFGVGETVIGEKIVLKAGTVVARGVVLLEPATCKLLGGKVEAWQKSWVEGRLARLREAVGADRR
ncbi:uncharacterized protein E0L32_002752 [Thyridium curvatum]|uniref:RecQ-mediated genome instability protein 1 n=1 Tax=Thyridium curvatum TaxID=1093900 RepID=A0A507BFH3_9PEZI|nr:uncharacterized protein E0L32_002752 [Thyridium curvatum]TPX18243.1 hypothetical protein E0L32_002752 [Thyridium curvatum]